MYPETIRSMAPEEAGRQGGMVGLGHLLARLLMGALIALLFFCNAMARTDLAQNNVAFSQLPAEAQETIRLIRQGGPFPYSKDGSVFGNHEGVLPKQKRGYYHEFTVRTPGVRNRGARRIVSGGDLKRPAELYYTDNHYASFVRIKE